MTLTQRLRDGKGEDRELKRLRAENRRLKHALEDFDKFAWSMVSLPPPAQRNLQGKIDRARALLALLAAKEPRP